MSYIQSYPDQIPANYIEDNPIAENFLGQIQKMTDAEGITIEEQSEEQQQQKHRPKKSKPTE